MNQKITFGQIVRPQGINGEVKIVSDFDETNGIRRIKELYRDDPWQGWLSLRVSSIACRDGAVFACFEGITDRNAAEKLRGTILFASRDSIVLEPNTNFAEDIIGCRLITQKGECLGEVTGIRRLPVHDVYIVKTPEGEAMVPALLRVFPSIDVENRIIRTDPEGFRECSVLQ